MQAYLNGIEPTAADFVLLIILGSLGSIGAAPVPYSSLVLIVSCSCHAVWVLLFRVFG